jgi:cell wall assembly regulator SMI1
MPNGVGAWRLRQDIAGMQVADSWARIVAWCREHAPAMAEAIRPPVGAAALERAQAHQVIVGRDLRPSKLTVPDQQVPS